MRQKPRTFVYIDGFNLYYGCLQGQPYRWLNLERLCQLLLPINEIQRINYYTARIAAPPNNASTSLRHKMARQEIYLRALRTLPLVSITYGHYLSHVISMPLAKPAPGGPVSAMVIKNEEKGSDVNLATHLVVDACRNAYDVAVVVSNDSDLEEPLRVVKREFGKVVGILAPILNPGRHLSTELRKQADFLKPIRAGVLANSQFPTQLRDGTGAFRKPARW